MYCVMINLEEQFDVIYALCWLYILCFQYNFMCTDMKEETVMNVDLCV